MSKYGIAWCILVVANGPSISIARAGSEGINEY